MSGFPRYEIEVVPRSAIRKGDTLLDISHGGVYELAVKSNPKPLGLLAKSVEVRWPGEDVERTYSLGERDAVHFRVVHDP